MNGVAAPTISSISSIFNTLFVIYLGGSPTASESGDQRAWAGSIAEFKIFRSALSAIQAREENGDNGKKAWGQKRSTLLLHGTSRLVARSPPTQLPSHPGPSRTSALHRGSPQIGYI